MNPLKLIVGMLALLVLVARVEAQTWFNENFDNPPYVAGQSIPYGLNQINYGEWVNLGGANEAVSSSSLSSPNSLQIENGGVYGYFGTNKTATVTTTNAIDFHFAVYATTSSPETIARVQDSNGCILGDLAVGYGPSGYLALISGAGGGVYMNITPLTPNTWYNVDMLMPANPSATINQYTIKISDSAGNFIGSTSGQFEGPTTANNYGRLQLYSTSTTVPTNFDNVSVTTSPCPSTLLDENFEEATLGGTITSGTGGTNTTGISPTVGSVSVLNNDYGIIVAGLNGSSKCLQAQDKAASQSLVLHFNPAGNPTTGIVSLSFDFLATGTMSGSSGPLQVLLEDGTALAGTPFLGLYLYSNLHFLATNSTSSLTSGGYSTATLVKNKQYQVTLALNLNTFLYSLSIQDLTDNVSVLSVPNLSFINDANIATQGLDGVDVSFGFPDFGAPPAAIDFDNLTLTAGGAVYGASDEEFLGPFASWINVKNAPYNAKGDGVTDDTAAIQSALNDVGTTGHGSVVYLPSGTYLITEHNTNQIPSGLVLQGKENIGMIGQDPLTTTIKWGGAQNSTDAMLWANGVTRSRFGRITWDGSGSTVTGWAHMENTSDPGVYSSCAIYRSDEVFQNMAIGLALGASGTNYGASDGDNNIMRDHFFNCSQAGVRTGSYNAFQNYIWDSEFVDNGTGMDDLGNGTSGGGNFNAYRCYFENSSVADLHSYYGFWVDFRSNTSVGSKKFFLNDGGAQSANPIVFQNNKILDSKDSATIAINELGNALLLDNQIRSLTGAVAPVVEMCNLTPWINGPDLNSVGNSYTIANPITVYGSTNTAPPGFPRWWTQNDQVVSTSSISSTVPTMPGTPANLGRPSMDVAATDTAAQINALLASPSGWAWTNKGQHPVLHFPAGNYPISQTIVVPAGLDVQLVGDSMATTFTWTGTTNGTMLQLTGPSKAYVYDIDFVGSSVSGGPVAGTAIDITDPDQVGAKIYIEGGIWQQFLQDGLYVDGCKNAIVECHAFMASGEAQSTNAGLVAKITGGGSAAGNGYTAIFGSDAGQQFGTLFQATNSARLVVTDHYYEGTSPRLIQLTGTNTVTFSADVYQAYQGIVEQPPIELDTFTGQATFINSEINRFNDTTTDPQILINGETSATRALFLGAEVGTAATSFTNYFSRPGSAGTVSLLNSKYTALGLGSFQVTNAGSYAGSNTPPSSLITPALTQMTNIAPTFPTTSGTGITEVRLIDVMISGAYGVGNCVQVGP